MKYAPKKVFILTAHGYEEISYKELCDREECDEEYKSKLFLPLHGALMEVSSETYKSYYREKRRQKYVAECAHKNGEFSYDSLDTAEFHGEDILTDTSVNVAEEAVRNILTEKLKNILLLLSTDEQTLLQGLYVEEKTERELAKEYGISQAAVHKKKRRILDKLKKHLEK